MSKLTYADRKKYGKVLYTNTAAETVTEEKEYYLPWQYEPVMEKHTTF